MKSMLKKIIHAGTKESMSKLEVRAIILTNSIALIAALLTSAYLAYRLQNNWSLSNLLIAITTAAMYGIPLLLRVGLINTGKILLTIGIPITSFTLMFMQRVQHPENFQYAPGSGIYAVLLATSVFPILIFSNRDRKFMYASLIVNLLAFSALDTGLRYYSTLHELPSFGQYLASNLALILSYLLLTGSVLSLKKIVDEFEISNNELIENLNQKNFKLEIQNSEIQAQQEELIQSQESLILANNEIERQKIALEQHNQSLEILLDEKSKNLLSTNQELVNQNNELQQFSYTLSHNLRGPVASMLGLFTILRMAETEEERNNFLTMLEHSTRSLETIIHDLNKIIDIRNDKFTLYETVSFEEELKLIRESLNSFITENEVHIDTDFQLPQITSVKAYVNSILYNLVSNAIQYRSPARKPHISITTTTLNGHAVLSVSDNGLGIDLSKFEDNLFKLYKRFHVHTQGKGLGLFLVKQQVEKLNGRIDVESKPDNGATFKVLLPVRAN